MPPRSKQFLRLAAAGVLMWSGPASAAQAIPGEVFYLEQKRQGLRESAVDEALEQAALWRQAEAQAQHQAREAAIRQALEAAEPPTPSPEPAALPSQAPATPESQGFAPPPQLEDVASHEATWLSRVNQRLSPLGVSGEVRSTVGATRDDFMLQEANGDLNERNFRVFSGPFRYNTFDPRIFSRTRVNLDTNETTNWQLHSNVTVDPWSFVGKTDRFTVVGDTPTDTVELELKWWSATNTAINETFLTQNNGDSIATPEIEAGEGRTVPTAVTSAFDNTFRIPSAEIDYTFQPIRWLWSGYKNDVVDLRVFPLALEDQALATDDPLQLSNHHIYWEPSPWLDEWVPGRLNTGATPDDFTRGEWSDDLTFFTRDSDLTRLTALRGTSLQWQPFEGTSLQAAIASPKGLWQEYERFNAFVGMARLKQTMFDERLTLGGTHTSRWAYAHRRKDATNHVYAVDVRLSPWPWITWTGEGAVSKAIQDRVSAFESDARGWAWHQTLTARFWEEQLTARLLYAHMDEGFDPGLANYRNTRDDQFWGRHLRFKKKPRLFQELSPVSPLARGDIDAVRIGDGIDVGRDVVGARLLGSLFDHRLEPLLDVRNVHRTNGKYLETVVRQENTITPVTWLTAKTLVLYHDLPHTTAGIDPFIIDDDLDRPYLNTLIVDDRSPSLQTYSVGAEVAPTEQFAVWGVWEHTNDTTVATDNFPRGLLNSSSFTTFTDQDDVIRIPSLSLFGQGFFPQPPYPFFDIFRAGLLVEPVEGVQLALDWTRNEFEHAGQIDDNLNHVGLMAAWSPMKRLIVAGRYVTSWAVDIADENGGAGKRFTRRHALFARLMWQCSDDSKLMVDFGEAAIGPSTLFTVDPYGDYYPTLDTEHLVRITYTNTF